MFQSVLLVTARDVQNVQLRRLEGRRTHAERNVFDSEAIVIICFFINLGDHRMT